MSKSRSLLFACFLLTSCGGGGTPPPVVPSPLTSVSIRHGVAGKLLVEAVLSNPITHEFVTVEPSPFLPVDVTYPWADFRPGEYELHTRYDDGVIRGPVTVIVSGWSMTIEVD